MDDLKRDVKVQRYYPNVLANAKEFKQLAILENDEFKSIWQVTCKWFLNTFVCETDLQGIHRWETMLKITPPRGATLEDRRRLVLRRINTLLPYTIRRLQEILDATYGEKLTKVSTNKKYELWVDIDNRIILKTTGMRTLLKTIIPANLIIKILQEMNANLFLYTGGLVSIASRIKINMNKSLTINEPNLKLMAAGKISIVSRIFLNTKNI